MSKNINITIHWNKDLALKASKVYYDWDMRNSRKRYVGWLFVALVQFGIVGALKHDSFGMLYLSTLLVGYWYYGRWYLRKKMILKYYDNSYIDNKDVKFILKDDGLHYANSLITWDEIIKVLKIDDDIIVQTTTNTLYFERKSFESYDDKQEFLRIMQKQGKL